MKTTPKTILKDMGGIILLAVVLALTYNYLSSKSISLVRKEAPKEQVSDAELFSSSSLIQETTKVRPDSLQSKAPVKSDSVKKAPVKKVQPVQDTTTRTAAAIGYKIISIEQFDRLRKEKRALILDAREPDEFKEGRIPGAINIPYLEVDSYFPKLADYPHDTLIVVYCSNLECPLGRGLTEFLVQMEFKKLYLFDEGYDYWEREDMPIEK